MPILPANFGYEGQRGSGSRVGKPTRLKCRRIAGRRAPLAVWLCDVPVCYFRLSAFGLVRSNTSSALQWQRKPLAKSRSEKQPTFNVQRARNSLSQCPTRATSAANIRKSGHNFAVIGFSCNIKDLLAVEAVAREPVSLLLAEYQRHFWRKTPSRAAKSQETPAGQAFLSFRLNSVSGRNTEGHS